MAFIWHLSVIQYAKHISVSGVILSGSLPKYKGAPKSLNNAIRTTKSYFKKPFGTKDISIKIGKKTIETRTLFNGSFSAIIEGLFQDNIEFYSKDGILLKVEQSYPQSFNFTEINKLVISDIDDTIMKSFTPTRLKRLTTTLFRPAEKRVKISATNRLYESFIKTHDAFCYVSKSEVNLSKLISEFIIFHDIPVGPLFLTPYLSFSELVRGKKDALFKFKAISQILDHCEGKTAILIGDDTQADMDIYALIVEKYGKRIDKVYIRQTGHKVSAIQNEKWEKLSNTQVEAIYYKDTDII